MPADPYLTSTPGQSELVPRVDPVVYSRGPGPLSPSQLEAFERDGFVVLPGWLAVPETAELRHEARRLTREVPEALVREPDSILIRSILEPHRHSAAFAAVGADPRLVDLARQIEGEVYLHRSRLDLKAALHGREFYWQSDFEVWHSEDGLSRMRAVTACLMLSGITASNAPLMVVPGSHKVFVRSGPHAPRWAATIPRPQDDDGPSRAALSWLVKDGGIAVITGVPGTVVLLDSNTLRASTCNLSPRSATTLFLAYNSVENMGT